MKPAYGHLNRLRAERPENEWRRAAERLRGQKPLAVLQWAAARFPGKIAFATSLGMEDQVVLDLLIEGGLEIPVFTLDTGRLFPETYDLLAATEARYGIRIQVYCPQAESVERLVAEHGVNLFRQSPQLRRECCRVRKVEPLRRALRGLSAWITGLRQEQAESRAAVEAVEWDERHGLLKINPLADWREPQVRDYLESRQVPYNPLHDRGFVSIGCACCTRAAAPGEDPRAGRWWWESREKKECGLHGSGRLAPTSPNCAEGSGSPHEK